LKLHYLPCFAVEAILNHFKTEILETEFVQNHNQNEVIRQKLLKINTKTLKRWVADGESLSWADYLMETRDFNFVDTTSNRLERRNIIIDGKRPIDVLCCIRSYFILQNIDALSRLNSQKDKGIQHKNIS
jgi:hypothetical protein